MTSSRCPSIQTLASFLKGTGTEDRDEIESHLSRCRSCRNQLVSLFDEMPRGAGDAILVPEDEQERPSPRGRMAVRASIGLAAALLLALVGLEYFGSGERPASPIAAQDREAFRQGASDSGRPRVEFPGEGTTVPRERVTITWLGVHDAQDYVLTLTDAEGTILSRLTTAQVEVASDLSALPSSRGKVYYCYVTARFADGSTRESSPRSFRIASK